MKISFLYFPLLLISLSCSSKYKKGNNHEVINKKEALGISNDYLKKEDFDSFFKRYQSDIAFMNERTIFPLEGYNSDDDELDGDDSEDSKPIVYHWKKDEWLEYAKIKYPDSEYKKRIEKSDTLVKHTIYIEGSGFKVYSKFKLINNKWHMIYYFYQNI